MICFLDIFKDRFGVERICVTLGATEGGFITAPGHRTAKRRPASARSVRDELLIGEVGPIHESNYSVYGVRKMYAAMRRAGWENVRERVTHLTATRPNQLWVADITFVSTWASFAYVASITHTHVYSRKKLAGTCHYDSRLNLSPCKHSTWPHG